MRIAIVSDAWAPQVNGVVRTLAATIDQLVARGHAVDRITPESFRTISCPSYPDIRLAINSRAEVARRLERIDPDSIHIATEGPLGWAARRWCVARGRAFTTSFHTRFPDYVSMRTGLPAAWFWPLIRRFHAPARRIMVATPTLAAELAGQGLTQTHLWSRGVDLDLFSPAAPQLAALAGLPRPIQLYVGRVAIEKNITGFLDTNVGGSKIVVGDGPAKGQLERMYGGVHFLGALHGAALASAYASADVFVFPSRTDTFGLVMVEALASGVPVAALPVPGPLDVIGRDGRGRGKAPIGTLEHDLGLAIERALRLPRSACAVEGRLYSWGACTDQFLTGLEARVVKTAIAA